MGTRNSPLKQDGPSNSTMQTQEEMDLESQDMTQETITNGLIMQESSGQKVFSVDDEEKDILLSY